MDLHLNSLDAANGEGSEGADSFVAGRSPNREARSETFKL